MNLSEKIGEFECEIESPNQAFQTFTLKAAVFESKNSTHVRIKYSHAGRPSEGVGIWYSNTFSAADSLDHAKAMIESYASRLSDSVEIEPWTDV